MYPRRKRKTIKVYGKGGTGESPLATQYWLSSQESVTSSIVGWATLLVQKRDMEDNVISVSSVPFSLREKFVKNYESFSGFLKGQCNIFPVEISANIICLNVNPLIGPFSSSGQGVTRTGVLPVLQSRAG